MKHHILAIVPARGGSKGIKNKNIIEIAEKPLIEYTLIPARRLLDEMVIDRLIVSTDSPKIADIARKLKIEVPFNRPSELAVDTAKTVDVVLHAVDYLDREGQKYDSVLLLQPTSPLRSYEDMIEAVALYDRHNEESLISVYREETRSDLILYHKEGNLAVPLNPLHNKGIRRQEQKEVYVRNGAMYITCVDYLKSSHSLIADKPLLYEMPKERSVNVDTQEDLQYLQWILTR